MRSFFAWPPACKLMLTLWSLSGVVQAESPRFGDLVNRVPGSANAIMAIDFSALMFSDLAQRQGWSAAHTDAYVSRALVVPPQADVVLVASELDAANHMAQAWELALIEMKEPVNMNAVARAEKGRQELIESLETVWSPSQAYFIKMGPQQLAVMSPDNRQAVARWALRSRTNHSSLMSPYLLQALERVSALRPVVLAVDLSYAVDPQRVRATLQDWDVLKKTPDRIPELVPLLSSLKGVTLSLRIDKVAEGVMTIDFGEDVSGLRSLMKPLVLEALDQFDLHLPGIDEWKFHLTSQQIELTGPLNDVALRRIFSLLEIPTTKFATLQSAEASEGTGSANLQAKRSQEYYSSVTALMEDLNSTLSETRDNHAVWMERYGKKIDQLPILNVDESLLDWGARVAETMRQMGLAERAAGIRSGVRKSSVYGNYLWSDYNSDGWADSTSSTANAYNEITTQERANARAVRYSSWKDLQDDTARIRREMTRKYQVEF